MSVELSPLEARVIGCLMEKSVVTPDQYPLTLNTLTNACNQKSSRYPVMSLEPGEVQRTVRTLQDKHLVRSEENFKTQVEKYTHRFCNTPFSDYQFNPAEFSVICVLLLRGARTPGEVRANVGRLHTFEDNQAVVETLNGLVAREEGALIVELPRLPGRKDSQYMHLLSGPVDTSAPAATDFPTRSVAPTINPELGNIAARVASLEAEVAELRDLLSRTMGSRDSDT